MSSIPRDTRFDSTLALLSEGYAFVSNRCRRYGSDLFETRLMLTKAVCMLGEEAARVFYEPHRFTRRQALPKPTLMLLQDKGSVALLDDEAHRWRKRMFMSLMSPAAIDRLSAQLTEHWQAGARAWTDQRIVLHDELHGVLCRAVCHWAGLTLDDRQIRARTREFAAMIEGAGAVGPRNWSAMFLRARSERWARDVIAGLRSRDIVAPEDSAADVIARHRDHTGQLLDTKVAAVELLNVLRPTVANARFMTFAALALHEHPAWRERLQREGDEALDLFVQEVRRFYPFFPMVGGRVREPFDWRGHHFAEGTWVLLDLYGTDHDERIWEEPDRFRPDRFRHWDGSPFRFVPQGGGDHCLGHRCAGEWITIALMKQAVRLLTTAMRYEVPPQDLNIDLSRLPAIPASRFVIEGVRPVG